VTERIAIRNTMRIVPSRWDWLRSRRAVRALPDQVGMPSPLNVVHRLDAVTGPFAYVRLLGDREAVDALPRPLDPVVIDWAGHLEADAQAVRLVWHPVPVVAFVNNHFAGYGPETVRQLMALTDRVASAKADGEPVDTCVPKRERYLPVRSRTYIGASARSALRTAACVRRSMSP
jgi:hypothetical protein